MGMYTELVCAFELNQGVRQQIINTLYYMTGQEDESILEEYGIPNHKLFETDRWSFMLKCDSYYFDGTTNSNVRRDNLYPDKPSYYVTIRCNLKNYDNEIDKFIDWITPFVYRSYGEEFGEKFIGYKMYEEDSEPTLICV